MSHTGPTGEPRRNLPQPPPSSTGWTAPTPGRPEAGTPGAPLPQGDARPGPGDPEPAVDADARRRRLLLVGGAVAAVVVVGGVLIAVLTGGDDEPGAAPAAETVTLAPPTPTAQPVARASTTAFAAALPPSVLQYALASSGPEDAWTAAGALEAYTETYSDGGTAQVVVQSGQWETPEEAAAQLAALATGLPAGIPADASASPSPGATTAPAPLPQTGEVVVDGQPVGTFTIVDAGDGSGIALWSNGTTVFRATAPVEQIRDVYAAFPL
ncbi:hypothetical protein [Cellulomonas sp. NS3]|uniref:hypothetical protein n=1 Tax=Cellulomonas sp. NS3 TaxID=2973977 RepID=UPI002163A7F8|nr:hypothetical protein [Cellulomonas sp. NS3]